MDIKTDKISYMTKSAIVNNLFVFCVKTVTPNIKIRTYILSESEFYFPNITNILSHFILFVHSVFFIGF